MQIMKPPSNKGVTIPRKMEPNPSSGRVDFPTATVHLTDQFVGIGSVGFHLCGVPSELSSGAHRNVTKQNRLGHVTRVIEIGHGDLGIVFTDSSKICIVGDVTEPLLFYPSRTYWKR